LFAFAGNAELRELDVKAGDEITVIREQAGDGWSLVRSRRGRVGLLPRSYFTVSFFLLHCLCSHRPLLVHRRLHLRSRRRQHAAYTPP
jgi:sorting nexin-9/18/33